MTQEKPHFLIDPESVKFDLNSGRILAMGRDELEGLTFDYVVGLTLDPPGNLERGMEFAQEQSVKTDKQVVIGFKVDVPKTVRSLKAVPTQDGYGIWLQSDLSDKGLSK